MDEVILERGGYEHEFITDFITYAISSCIVGNANGICHFRVVKYLRNIDEIQKYNWSAYAMKCLDDAVVEWKKDMSKFFTGSLLFLMVERSFLVAINWDTEKVRNRDKDEQLTEEYGKGRIIERIDCQTIARLAEADLDMTNLNKEELVRRPGQQQLKSNDVHTAHIAMDNVKASYISMMIQFSSEFLEQVDQPESTVREQIQQRKRVAYSPPSFGLGISLEKEATAAPSAHTTPATVQFQLGENTTPREPPATGTEQQTYEGSEQPINPDKSPKTTKGTHKAVEKLEIKKAKQMVLRQQPKKMLKQMLFNVDHCILKTTERLGIG
ncbi:hypothetical protein Cgig2_016979 [Carnegiea gigantea]|uniref:Aminotransferase-like plant mobile domain-containing protein n=1 Tax=Carnegiea gigantea TaxID=171969 RepID=A0A9Q1KIL4_9CARY|nr:hypothetical protein Cgig2_016979 [Carnegiea gigantea]